MEPNDPESILHNPIKELLVQNQRILDFIANQTTPASALPPDLVNTKIVAQARVDSSQVALNEYVQNSANGMSNKKLKKLQTRLENNLVKEIAFGSSSSLQELIDQANVEMKRIGVTV